MGKFRNILGAKNKRVQVDGNIQFDFVTLASHQLRTPLSAIRWYTEMLLDKKRGKLTKNQQSYLGEIYRATERTINLVNDLLDVSRIQEGKINLEVRETRIEDVIEEVIKSLDTLSRASNISITFEIVRGPLPKLQTDREKLKRIIVNLLSNSIKYTPQDGKVTIRVERMANKPKMLKISVSDSGIGISKGEQKRVFEKFFRSPDVVKKVPDGTGLGLFIAKSLVEAMGGEIGFDSEEGQGSTFYFTIPINT